MGTKCQARHPHPQPQPSGHYHSPKVELRFGFSCNCFLLLAHPIPQSSGIPHPSSLILVGQPALRIFFSRSCPGPKQSFYPRPPLLAHHTHLFFTHPVLPVSFLHLIHLPIQLSSCCNSFFPPLPSKPTHPHSLYSFPNTTPWRLLHLGTAGKSQVVTTPIRVHKLLYQPSPHQPQDIPIITP